MKVDITQLKLFLVKFGKPTIENVFGGGSSQDPVFVLAKDYDEAAKKAEAWVEENFENKGVVAEDGSLNVDMNQNRIKSVEIASDKLIY